MQNVALFVLNVRWENVWRGKYIMFNLPTAIFILYKYGIRESLINMVFERYVIVVSLTVRVYKSVLIV